MLLPELDIEKTCKNVRALFKQYPSLERLAGEEYTQHLTASYSLEPRTKTNKRQNSIENMVTRKVKAQQILADLYGALNRLPVEHRNILWRHHVLDNITDYVIEQEFYMGRTKYYEFLRSAEIEFAEVYNKGELLVEKTDKVRTKRGQITD